MTKLCDGCRVSNAAIYCTADMAYICLGCDLKVHGANKLASRHERVWICEVCEHAPAAVICKADAAALCASCDTDIHSANPLANRHERVAVTPFFECPSMIKVAHINASSVVPNYNPLLLAAPDCWQNPQQQQQPLANFGVIDSLDSFLEVGAAPNLPGFLQEQPEGGSYSLGGTGTTISLSQTRSSSVAAVPESSSSMSDISKPYPGNMIEFLCQISRGEQGIQQQSPGIAREERVLRYKEKRKNRKFEKTVRYASRKAYAEIRPRIKGRFVKRSDVEHFVLSAMADGIVPSF
ncbi:zinc finger protein CONSTANS-LIKE 3 [Selaginella moellendorffii]|nr:zinc finger protein CONSTANS-LIKE 3 [Selaginella moellendorffii]|eukprot:XP_002975083.2 zinc finger protein CONSTANS-LIKE 3 [Selaginella moellendorffii]